GNGLVEVAQDELFASDVADVGDVEGQVIGQLLLDGEVPTVDVAGAVVDRLVVDAGARRRVLLLGGAVRWEAVLSALEAGREVLSGAAKAVAAKRRRRLRLRDAEVERPGEAENILAAHAVEVDEAASVACAENSPLDRVVGEADARRPVIAI